MLKIFLAILVILLPAVLLMGHRIFFTKKGKFPPIHVDTNPALRKRGIRCVQTQDREARKPNPHKIEMVKKD
ncbi:MAG: hypothetical protein IAC32_01025 [Bacteroidetes bacterium]|uniref:Uncharacterized protein n=1 Tax=Candidatus Enterocola intestinipullorum TaxID=2840783 RepID=A0A9D9EFG9_9BACT|nr:hypothetical protein [Candidatus Enterocola intestinipullorum]